jgi:hypothetical protein
MLVCKQVHEKAATGLMILTLTNRRYPSRQQLQKGFGI